MRHQAFQAGVFGRADRLQNFRRGGARSQPSHAAVDFQMIVARLPARSAASRSHSAMSPSE